MNIFELIQSDTPTSSIPYLSSSKNRTKLTISIMLPQDFIRLRNFHVCINREISKINKGNWSFTKHFYIDR
jgi:hypothetical protein